jgi:hypothetical protein
MLSKPSTAGDYTPIKGDRFARQLAIASALRSQSAPAAKTSTSASSSPVRSEPAGEPSASSLPPGDLTIHAADRDSLPLESQPKFSVSPDVSESHVKIEEKTQTTVTSEGPSNGER